MSHRPRNFFVTVRAAFCSNACACSADMPRSIIAWNGLEDGLLRNPRFTQAWTAAHPRTSRTPCFVDGLLFLASQRTIAPMNLVTLDWNREPHLCEAVIRETQEYRRRDPLPLAPAEPLQLVPVHPAPRPALWSHTLMGFFPRLIKTFARSTNTCCYCPGGHSSIPKP